MRIKDIPGKDAGEKILFLHRGISAREAYIAQLAQQRDAIVGQIDQAINDQREDERLIARIEKRKEGINGTM